MKTNHTYKTYAIAAINQVTVKDILKMSEKTGVNFKNIYKVLMALKDVVKNIETR